MGIKPDHWIRRMAKERGMIEPFVDGLVREGVVSYGLSSYGYDIRISDEFKVFGGISSAILDPKRPVGQLFVDFRGAECVIQPHTFVLGRSVEYFRLPRDVLGICVGKSTYARCGLIVNVTPLEPEWEGYLTIALVNPTPLPVKVYANEGIAQLLFIGGDGICEQSYADKKGKYQGQTNITLSRIDQ